MEECAQDDQLEFLIFNGESESPEEVISRGVLDAATFLANLIDGWEGTIELKATQQNKARATFESEATLALKVKAVFELHDPHYRIQVKVLAAQDLPDPERQEDSLRYVTVCLTGKPKSQFRTRVIPRTVNPSWQEAEELPNYEAGDGIIVRLCDLNEDEALAEGHLRAPEFHPGGFKGSLPLLPSGSLHIMVEVLNMKPKETVVDPAEDIGPENREPVPFQLCCLETGRRHRLNAFTQVGRSTTQLDPLLDLILNTPGNNDVSRVHATIKSWRGQDPNAWYVRIYDTKGGGLMGQGPGGGHAGGGTSIDGRAVDALHGTMLEAGSILRFGRRELWALERSALHPKSPAAVHAQKTLLDSETMVNLEGRAGA